MACHSSWIRLALLGVLGTGVFGCELIASVDRGQIPPESTNVGGGAGDASVDGSGGAAGLDASVDASDAETDAQADASADVSTDALIEAEAGSDSAADGPVDAKADADAGPECTSAADCPAPANECITRTCTSGKCGTNNVAVNTVTTKQTAGDCHSNQCDGKGAVVPVIDNTDVPVDNNPCTDDVCTAGAPSNPLKVVGTGCGGVKKCDASGVCQGCLTGSDCGTDTECLTNTCTGGACGVQYATAGKVVTAQTAGDCKSNQCDATGHVVPVTADTDKPADGTCTRGTCTNGVASQSPVSAGTGCNQGGGTVCNDVQQCVVCWAPSCSVSNNGCQTGTCGGDGGTCGVSLASEKTPCGQGGMCNAAGACVGCVDATDCAGADAGTPFCSASGACVECLLTTDCPGINNECQSHSCSAGGVCQRDFQPVTASCTQGGSHCDGAGTCVCVAPTDCGTPPDCQVNTCTSGVCGLANDTDGNPCAGGASTCLGGVCQ